MREGYGPLILKWVAAAWLSFAAQSFSLAATSTFWWNSRVDRSVPYWQISLALDASGNPHMAYHDYVDGYIKYVSKESSNWTIENMDYTKGSGEYVSLALDAGDNPHIAYSYHQTGVMFGCSTLRYGSRSVGKWNVEIVDSRARCCGPTTEVCTGMWSSLALDARGKAHIAFHRRVDSLINRQEVTSTLEYATNSRGRWTVETVNSNGEVGQYASLALDNKGNPRIAYYDMTNHDLKYASKNGGKWTVETVPTSDSDEWYRWHVSLALDAGGNPHIAYYEMTEWMRQGNLKYASKKGGSWTVETVDSNGEVGQYASLALDNKGNPRIAYHDHTHGCLKFASKDRGNWAVEAVDCTALVVGFYASLAFDAYGSPRIAYYDVTNNYVKYASAAVELNYPGNWKIGTSSTVTWQGKGMVDLSISRDGGKNWILLANGLVNGSYDFQVPNLPTKSAKIKLERATPHSVTITRGFFTIAP